MSGEKAVSRPWSQLEDDLLRIAVSRHGVQDNWKAVADDVPGRNNKACRKVCIRASFLSGALILVNFAEMASFTLSCNQEICVDYSRRQSSCISL